MYQAHGNTGLARRLLWIAAMVDVWVLFAACCVAASGLANLVGLGVVLLLSNIVVGWYALSQGVIFEYRQERTWKAVCGGIGFKGEGKSYWHGWYGAHVKGETRTIHPKLRHVHGNYQSWTGIVTPFAGQVVADYTKEAEAFAFAFHTPFASFEETDTGLIRIRCGTMPLPAAFDYEPVAVEPRASLQALPMARTLDERTWSLPIEGQHLLVAGRSGSGKSSYVWTFVLRLESARQAGLVRLWAVDPKRVELAIGKQYFYRYANKADAIVELIEEFRDAMQRRGDDMEGRIRKFTPSKETPLEVLLIDEMAYVTVLLPDKKLRDRVMPALTTVLNQGRAIGFSVFSAIQDPKKEVLPNRDGFSIRIALGLPEKQLIDMVLGDGMHDAGARANQCRWGQRMRAAATWSARTTTNPY